MKNIYKLLTLVLTLTIVSSCDRDQGEYPYLDNREVTIGFRGAEGTILVENGADNMLSAIVGASTVVPSGSYSVSVDGTSTAVLGVDYDFVSGTDGSFESGNILSSISIVADFANSTSDGKTIVLNLISNDPSLSVAEAFSQYTINLIQFCESDIAGMYSMTTTYGFHDFLPTYDTNTQEIEIVELGEGSYSIADFTGGLYSVGPYSSSYGTGPTYAEITENCDLISWSGQSDEYGAMIPTPGGANSVDSNGVITINWTCEGYGEYGTSIYTPL